MALNHQPATDKRRWERRQVNVPIRVSADNLTGMRVVLARGTRISEGGICLFALANLAIGDEIDIELIDPEGGTSARLSGIVRNRTVYLYGVEFLHLTHSHKQFFRLLVNQ